MNVPRSSGLLVALALGALYLALAFVTRPTGGSDTRAHGDAAPASASTSQPGPSEASSPVEIVTTASYAVSVARERQRVTANDPFDISVAVHTLVGDLPMSASAQAFPGLDADGNPVRIDLHPAGRNRYTGSVIFPAVGAWELDIDAATLGNPPERAIFAVPVAAPNALPAPVAWLLAILPLIGLGAFARAEALRLRALPPERVIERLPFPRG